MRTWSMVVGVFATACSTDTFVSADAGSDAFDAAGGSFCAALAPAPYFCMDFDEGDPATAFKQGTPIKVQTPTSGTGTTFALGKDGVAGSGDALFTTPSITSGTRDDWYAQPIVYEPVALGVSLKFAFRLDTYKQSTNATITSSAEIAQLHVNEKSGGASLLGIFFLTGEGHAGITFNGADGPMFQVLSLPTAGPWHQVELDVTRLTQH